MLERLLFTVKFYSVEHNQPRTHLKFQIYYLSLSEVLLLRPTFFSANTLSEICGYPDELLDLKRTVYLHD